MNKRVKQRLSYVMISSLALLALILIFNYFKATPRTNPFQVSLIQRNVSDEYSQLALKQGVDQGINEHSLELSAVFFDDSLAPNEQIKLVKKEVANGAEGLLIEGLDSLELGMYLSKISQKIPVVLLNNQLKKGGNLTVIQSENFEMGATLGEFILNNGKQPRKRILLLKNDLNYEEVKSQYEGVRSILNKSQFSLATREITGTEAEQKTELERILFEDNYECIVAFSLKELEALSLLKQQHESLSDLEIYGFGKTNMIISGLEDGYLEGIAVSNQYAVGYLGIKEIVSPSVDPAENLPIIEYNVITRETIFAKENEQFLFPFIQ